MTQFFALLRLQMLSRFADLKPKNLRKALEEKRGRTLGMIVAIFFLIVYLGVILYIIETKALDVLSPAADAPMAIDLRNMLVIMAVVLSTAGTLIMAFFFIMSSLYLGRDAAFLASMPIKPRTLLSAKLAQIWVYGMVGATGLPLTMTRSRLPSSQAKVKSPCAILMI